MRTPCFPARQDHLRFNSTQLLRLGITSRPVLLSSSTSPSLLCRLPNRAGGSLTEPYQNSPCIDSHWIATGQQVWRRLRSAIGLWLSLSKPAVAVSKTIFIP